MRDFITRDGFLYYNDLDDRPAKFTQTGEKHTRYEVAGRIVLAEKNRVFVLGRQERMLYCLDEKLGTRLQRFSLQKNDELKSVDVFGNLLCLVYPKILLVYDCESAQLMMEREESSGIVCHAFSGSNLLLGTARGLCTIALARLKPASGKSSLRGSLLLNVPSGISPDMTHLDLSSNKLTNIRGLQQLTQLTDLNLSNNALHTLPGSIIEKLAQLKQLDLSSNKLRTLPPEIGSLSAMEVLRLADNDIAAIPDQVGRLNKLLVLDLSKNTQLKQLPRTIAALENLQQLELDRCEQLQQPPLEIAQLGVAAVRDYLEELNKSIRRVVVKVRRPRLAKRLHALQVNIVGHANSGKTTLLRAVKKVWNGDPGEAQLSPRSRERSRTEYIEIHRVEGSAKRDFTLIFWDYPGQPEYYASYNMFVTVNYHVNVFVVVSDLSKPRQEREPQLAHWLRMIQAKHLPTSEVSAKCPIYLVGSHCDPEVRETSTCRAAHPASVRCDWRTARKDGQALPQPQHRGRLRRR